MKRAHPIFLMAAALAILWPQATVHSQVNLNAASSYAVLAGTAITNTGNTVVTGNLGVVSGTAVTGFPPGVVNFGSMYYAGAGAVQAQAAAASAYAAAVGQAATITGVTGFADTATLVPGVYNAASSLLLSGNITLSGAGSYIFQIGSTLTTASDTRIMLSNGAQADNVFWQVGSSATFGTGSEFAGTVLAHDSITMTTGASADGGLFALNAAVTLDDNIVSAVPEPVDTALLIAGFVGLVIGVRKIQRHFSNRKIGLTES